VNRWRQAAQDANQKPVLTMAEQKELEKLRAQDQREIKAIKKGPLPIWGVSFLGGIWRRQSADHH